MGYVGLNFRRQFFSLSVLCGLVFLVAGTRETQAQTDAPDVSVQISAVSGSAVVGEPILLRCVINNQTESVTTLQTGPGNDTWYSVTMIDVSGQPVPDGVEGRPPFLSAAYGGSKLVPAFSSDTRTLVLKPGLGLNTPGRYTVVIKVGLPYSLSPGQDTQSSPSVLSETFSIPISVTATDHSKIQGHAKTIVAALSGSPRGEQADEQVRILLSMSEADALQPWQQLIHNTQLDVIVRDNIPRLLFQVNSLAASDLLLDMSQDPAQGPIVQNQAALYLDRMYRTGSQIQKKHIESIFAARGLSIPANPLISID